MTEADVLARLDGNKRLPSLPQVLQEIIRNTRDSDPSSKELADVIKKDPSLTTQLLRVVNSPFYKHSGKISSINFAVAQLGPRAVMAMALSTGLYRVFGKYKANHRSTRFWRHSLETAVICREIAKACGFEPVEEAFVLGLMHDIGFLVLHRELTDQYKKIWEKVDGGMSLDKAEQQLLGTDHARAGQYLLDKWNLPPFMGEVVANHHQGWETLKECENRTLACIINLGNRVSKFHIYQQLKDELNAMTTITRFGETLGMTSLDIMQLQSQSLEKVSEESMFLDMNTESLEKLLEEANDILYRQFTRSRDDIAAKINRQMSMAGDDSKENALETFKNITASLAQYLNLVTANLMGGARLIHLAIEKGKITDNNNIIANYAGLTSKSAESVAGFLDQLKKLSHLKITGDIDETDLRDIEKKIKTHIEKGIS